MTGKNIEPRNQPLYQGRCGMTYKTNTIKVTKIKPRNEFSWPDIQSVETPLGSSSSDKHHNEFGALFLEFVTGRVRCDLAGMVESHIELALAECLVAYMVLHNDFENCVVFSSEKKTISEKMVIIPQFKIGKFRVDFLICDHRWGMDYWFVVECDGHEFHEKTKPQAAKDKERDRRIQSDGYPILRFTGSEIWNDPYSVAEEIYHFSLNEANRRRVV